MVVAGEWYEVGGFWVALASVIVALGAGILAAMVPYRATVPKRRVIYTMSQPRPLLKPDADRSEKLEVRHEGIGVDCPYVVDIGVGNDGSRDIPGTLFHAQEPLVFNLSAPILQVLRVKSNPASSPLPTLGWSSAHLKIGPSLLARRQILTISLLVNGKPSSLTCSSSHLIDVDVVGSNEVAALSQRLLRVLRVVASLIAGVSIFVPLLLGLPTGIVAFFVGVGGLLLGLVIASTSLSTKIFRSNLIWKDEY